MRRSKVVTLAACGVLLLVLGIVGAILVTADSGRPADYEPSTNLADPRAASVPAEPAEVATVELEPEIVSWGTDGEVLSLVIRNQGARTLQRARVLITGLDRHGRAVFATTGSAHAKCCTIVGLAPGGEFGLFVTGATDFSSVTEVFVRYLDPRFADASRSSPVAVTNARLTRQRDDAVVTATITSADAAYVAGQAFLVDANGGLVAVISGRFYCFEPGQSQRVRMELTRPIPPGTRLLKAVAHPVAAPPARCRRHAGAAPSVSSRPNCPPTSDCAADHQPAAAQH